MPCLGPFNLSYSVHYIYDFCPLPDPDVGLSIFVCAVEHTSFHFGMCGRNFVLCLFGQGQMLQEVQIMEDTLMIPPAPSPNLPTSRKP